MRTGQPAGLRKHAEIGALEGAGGDERWKWIQAQGEEGFRGKVANTVKQWLEALITKGTANLPHEVLAYQKSDKGCKESGAKALRFATS